MAQHTSALNSNAKVTTIHNSQLSFEFLGLMTTFQKNEENEIIRSQIECAFLSIRSQNWPLALSSRISFPSSLIYNYLSLLKRLPSQRKGDQHETIIRLLCILAVISASSVRNITSVTDTRPSSTPM